MMSRIENGLVLTFGTVGVAIPGLELRLATGGAAAPGAAAGAGAGVAGSLSNVTGISVPELLT